MNTEKTQIIALVLATIQQRKNCSLKDLQTNIGLRRLAVRTLRLFDNIGATDVARALAIEKYTIYADLKATGSSGAIAEEAEIVRAEVTQQLSGGESSAAIPVSNQGVTEEDVMAEFLPIGALPILLYLQAAKDVTALAKQNGMTVEQVHAEMGRVHRLVSRDSKFAGHIANLQRKQTAPSA